MLSITPSLATANLLCDNRCTVPAAPPYTSKILKATALLADTRTLLTHWNTAETVDANLDRLRRENAFGKASRSRITDLSAILRQRYLNDDTLRNALVILAQGGLTNSALDRILYYLSLRNDTLLHDTVTELLLPAYGRGQLEITTQFVVRWLREQVAAGLTATAWSEETLVNVAQHLLATLRDFGVLAGAVRKRITVPYLPLHAFCFLAHLRYRELGSGDSALNDPEWRAFFMPALGVERLFVEAHQQRLLEYQAAGRVVRITFPALSLEDYARSLVARSHPATGG